MVVFGVGAVLVNNEAPSVVELLSVVRTSFAMRTAPSTFNSPAPCSNMFEQGAGELNVDGAVRMAKLVRTTLNSSTTLGASLLTSTAPTPKTTISTYTFTWSQGAIVGPTYVTASGLITQYQRV